MSPPSDADWAWVDLIEAVEAGWLRGAHLLTQGEHRTVRRLVALTGDPAAVYARLVARKPLAFVRDELTIPGLDDPDRIHAAVAELTEGGWVDGLVPWPLRAELLPARRLRDACRALGLKVSGRHHELVERLAPHRGWCPSPFVRPRHRGLVRRLQRWATMRAWPRPEQAVLERMGQARWPDYALTRGAGLHRDRRALRAWEALHGQLGAERLTAERALAALRDGSGDAPGRLSLRGTLRRALRAHARQLERSDAEAAVRQYEELVPHFPPGALAFRHARALEACDRPADAFACLVAARAHLQGDARAEVLRAQRRLGRKLGRGVAPDPPLAKARRRSVSLERVRADHRPLWRGCEGGEEAPVEDAVIAHLAARGRHAAHVEGRLFRTLFALLMADCYFLPVPGQLPVARLTGPLDLGRPEWSARRADAVDAVLDGIARGEGTRRIRAALATYGEVRLAGRHDLDPDLLVATVDALPPSALRAIVETLATTRSSGLPDLIVLPGDRVEVDGHPRRVREGLLLVEVKGPGDTLSEAQRAWHDRLLGWGLHVEVWDVKDRPVD